MCATYIVNAVNNGNVKKCEVCSRSLGSLRHLTNVPIPILHLCDTAKEILLAYKDSSSSAFLSKLCTSVSRHYAKLKDVRCLKEN